MDDDPDIRRLVVRRLQQANHRARGASDASEACAFIAENEKPDILVLDVDLPDGSGLALLSRLREQTATPDLPAIFLSQRVRPEDVAAGRALGATYLTKPFIANALLGAVDAIIAEQRRIADDAW